MITPNQPSLRRNNDLENRARQGLIFLSPLSSLAQELIIRGFSQRTIKAYLAHNKHFLAYANKSAKEITAQDIKGFLLLLRAQGYSNTSLNNVISALRFYYQEVLRRKLFNSIKRPKKEKVLPVVLTREEIMKIINASSNPKHSLLLALAYSSGLRVSEVVALRAKDIDFDQHTVLVRQGKGAKDRMTIYSAKLDQQLRVQISNRTENDYIFSNHVGHKLTTRTAQKIFSHALQKTDLKKSATFHSLRHSFATHLLDQGTSVMYIQKLLGHQRLSTTQHYLQVNANKLKNIISPF